LITEARIRRSLAENGKQPIGQLVDPIPFLSPDSPLIGAAMRMHETKTRQMPVVQGSELVGLLTMTDIVAAQALAAKDASGMDRTATPAFAEERTTLEE
jgi:predicted transcriptional regulator